MEQNRIQRMRTEKEDETKIELIVRRRVKECERELKKKQEKIMAEKEEKKEWSGGARIHQWYIDGRDTKLLYTFLYQWKGYNYCYPLFFDGHDYMRIIDSRCIEINALS